MVVLLREFKAPKSAKAGEEAPFKAEAYPNLYVPMSSEKFFGDGTPVNSLMVKQRREIMKEWFGEQWNEGAMGTVYKGWLYCVLSIIAVIVFYGINLWVSQGISGARFCLTTPGATSGSRTRR